MKLTKQHVLNFLATQRLMSIATYGKFPWIASVYYSFDRDLNLYFLSSPTTLHCKQIIKNPQVAVAIADSQQGITVLKRGLQLWGEARQISNVSKIKHALHLWKSFLKVKDRELTYKNMFKKVVSGRMYIIKPKRIKLFDQKLFRTEDGKEPVLKL